MKAVNILKHAPANVKNEGDKREYAVCNFEGITRVKHDSGAYNRDSDVNIGNRHISVKASGFTLMSGNLCEGKTEFNDIWALYAANVHSNEWYYVTRDFIAYCMNLEEFKTFVYTFCKTERESAKNGGAVKIRCRKESAKMLKWLEENAA